MKVYKKVVNGFNEFVFADDQPEGYSDATNVSNIILAGHLLFKDYKFVRKQLQDFASLSWNTLSDPDKIIVSKYRASSESNCQIVLGDTYQYWASEFGLLSKLCREIRFENAKTILFQNISIPNRYVISGFLKNNPDLRTNYILDGIEGTLEMPKADMIEGIFNYIEATPESAYYDLIDNVKVVKPQFLPLGITNNNGVIIDAMGNALGKYETTGIAAMNLTMLGEKSKEQLVIELMDCLRNGNY